MVSMLSLFANCITHMVYIYFQKRLYLLPHVAAVCCRPSVSVTASGLVMLTFSLDFPKEIDACSCRVESALMVHDPPSHVGELSDDADACGKQDDGFIWREVYRLPKGALDHRSHCFSIHFECVFIKETLGETAFSLD